MKILVVDDEKGLRDMLVFLLKAYKFDTATAANAKEGLEQLRACHYDAVITDVRMPGEMDGVGMIESWRNQKPDQGVMFVTGYATEERLQIAACHPRSRLVHKPFRTQDLLATLCELLAIPPVGN